MATVVPAATMTRYFDDLGRLLGRVERRASFAMYAAGLLSDLERKSVEPIAARASDRDPKLCFLYHHRLLNLLNASPWDDAEVRSFAAHYALDVILEQETLDAWVLDDTGFLKQGADSVGVQRQYTGSAGKITNCQIGVSLTAATRTLHVPVDMDLYLPTSWTDDPVRRKMAKIPDSVTFRTKHDIALDLLAQARLDGHPKAPVLADAAYGTNARFRGELTLMGFPYAVGIESTVLVQRVRSNGRRGPERSVQQLAKRLKKKAWKKVTWLEGTSHPLASRFARLRVHIVNGDPNEPEEQWLLIEWPQGEPSPTHFTVSTLPEGTSRKELVRLTKARWRTERVYEDLKGELGLDHYEGRSYVGWQHHISTVLACSALVVACQRRAFPPSALGGGAADPERCAA